MNSPTTISFRLHRFNSTCLSEPYRFMCGFFDEEMLYRLCMLTEYFVNDYVINKGSFNSVDEYISATHADVYAHVDDWLTSMLEFLGDTDEMGDIEIAAIHEIEKNYGRCSDILQQVYFSSMSANLPFIVDIYLKTHQQNKVIALYDIVTVADDELLLSFTLSDKRSLVNDYAFSDNWI